MIYSGNSDTGVPTIGTHRWIYDLKLAETSEWRPYYLQTGVTTHQIAGYTETRTGGEGMGNLTFATVHGGGQLTGRGKPAQTLHLISRFINGEDL